MQIILVYRGEKYKKMTSPTSNPTNQRLSLSKVIDLDGLADGIPLGRG
jgi:hypothetical protein